MLIMVRADPIAPDCTRLFSRIYGLTEDIEEQEVHLQTLEITNGEDTDMVTISCRTSVRRSTGWVRHRRGSSVPPM